MAAYCCDFRQYKTDDCHCQQVSRSHPPWSQIRLCRAADCGAGLRHEIHAAPHRLRQAQGHVRCGRDRSQRNQLDPGIPCHVVPANAGTARCGLSLKDAVGRLSRNTTPCGYGSRRSPGRRCVDTPSRSRGTMRPSCCKKSLPPFGGRGECRVLSAPAAPCATKKHRGRSHRYAGTPGIPARNGFNGFLRALLGDRACLPPSPRGYFRET